MEITERGFTLEKEIQILDIIQEIVPNNSWIKQISPQNFIKDIDIKVAINNKKDIMVQIKPKDKNYYTGFDEFERSRFYLYETFESKNLDCEGKATN